MPSKSTGLTPPSTGPGAARLRQPRELFLSVAPCGGHRGAMERVKGIEPSYSAWKAAALPLSYTRKHRSLQEQRVN